MNASRATILIVDDEVKNRKLLETLLRHEGHDTICAANGEEALHAVAQAPPDLILLDVMMPGVNGYQVAAVLKANPHTAHIPIIMVTAQIDRGARLAALGAGAEEFLGKPVDRAELWIRVRNLLRLKNYSDLLKNQSLVLEQQVQLRTVELQRFRTAMDATAEAIILIALESMQLIEMNASAERMFGFTRTELVERGPAALTGMPVGHLSLVALEMVNGTRPRFQSEVPIICKDGSILPCALTLTVQQFAARWIVVGVIGDITERKQTEMRLHHLAHYDSLTGLPNRTLFYETLRTALAAATAGAPVALLCIDVDYFKNVNDTLGHALGDELLRQFSTRLVECVHDRDAVGRLGGDEFYLILPLRENRDAALVIANMIRDCLRRPFDLNGREVIITASIGITICPNDANDAESLLKSADTAMYRAKQAGRDTFRFFTAEMNTEVLARLELEAALRKALVQNEFMLHYQPKVQINSGRITGFEALLRWNRPGHGLVGPAVFIPVLEECGLIIEVGAWVIDQACRQILAWTTAGLGAVSISVNVSARQLIVGDLEADVDRAIAATGISADQLELELTESSLMANAERTIRILQNLRSRGVQISIDDFGTGYSSLAYLRRFPVDKLKIDIAFVRDVTFDPDAAAIVLAIIRMAHSLKLEVIGEGVETPAQLASLRRHRCDHIQGYHFSPPVPVAAAEQMLRDGRRLQSAVGDLGRGAKILLLLDDNPHTLAALQRTLCEDGYEILSASSAAEGFELLALYAIQVVLCDQRMPTMSGTAFLGQVKELYPATLRIILSGHTEVESIIDAINCGAIYRFYTKPWDRRVLRDNIREAFRHHWRMNLSS